MDQSHPELGFTSRTQGCTHGSLSLTHCGHGHKYPSYRPLTGCDHEGTYSSQREAAVDEGGVQPQRLRAVTQPDTGVNDDVIIVSHSSS